MSYKNIIYIEDLWNNKFYKLPQVFEYDLLLDLYSKA